MPLVSTVVSSALHTHRGCWSGALNCCTTFKHLYCSAETSFETVFTPATTPSGSPYEYVATPVTGVQTPQPAVAIPFNEAQMKTPDPKHGHRIKVATNGTPQSNENVTASAAKTQTSQKRKNEEANQAVNVGVVASSPAVVQHISFSGEVGPENKSVPSPAVQADPSFEVHQEPSSAESGDESPQQPSPSPIKNSTPSPSPIINSTPNKTPIKAATPTQMSTPTSTSTPTLTPIQTPVLAATPTPQSKKGRRTKQVSLKKKQAESKAKAQVTRRTTRSSPKPSPAPTRPAGSVCSAIVRHSLHSCFFLFFLCCFHTH